MRVKARKAVNMNISSLLNSGQICQIEIIRESGYTFIGDVETKIHRYYGI